VTATGHLASYLIRGGRRRRRRRRRRSTEGREEINFINGGGRWRCSV